RWLLTRCSQPGRPASAPTVRMALAHKGSRRPSVLRWDAFRTRLDRVPTGPQTSARLMCAPWGPRTTVRQATSVGDIGPHPGWLPLEQMRREAFAALRRVG